MPDPDPITFAAVLGSIYFLFGLYNQVMLAVGKRRLPQPFPVAMAERFVEVNTYDADRQVINERLTKATESRKAMHRDIEDVRQRTSVLETANRAQTDELRLLSADFREFAREQRAVNNLLINQKKND